jgi:hypothetical protein
MWKKNNQVQQSEVYLTQTMIEVGITLERRGLR